MNSNVRSVGVKDVDQNEFVKGVSAFLKKSGKLRVPEWVDMVKTAAYKELAPYDEDWYYTRCAAVARHIYMRSPIGVGALTKMYGGRHRRGVRPSHFARGGQNIARKSLQSLEALGWIEKDSNSGGRKLTSQGTKDLNRIAAQIQKAQQAAAVSVE